MVLSFKYLNFLLILLLLTGLQACSTTTGQSLANRDMDANSASVRTLKVLVATDGTYDRQTIEQHIANASKTYENQFGIRLEPVRVIPISWGKRDVNGMLNKLYETANGCDFDIAVGYAKWTPGEYLARNFIGGWDGAIDDTYRRFLVIKNLGMRTMLHELGHAFIFSEAHSGLGLMSPLTIQPLPFIPVTIGSNNLDDHLRSEILKNKWRDFPKVVETDERPNPIVARATGSPACG